MNHEELFSVQGKVVLITGSGRGIGKELARAFLDQGSRVVLHGSDHSKIEPLATDWKCDFVWANFNDEEAIQKMIQVLYEKVDRLDVIIHNAAMESIQPFEKIELENFDRHMQINLRSVIQLTRGLFPLLQKSEAPSIIHVSSIHEEIAYPHNACYAMTKSALAMLTKTLALEWGPLGIRVNSLAPGAVETDMNREIVHAMEKEFKEWIPLGRVATTDEMIGPALFLASKASSYMTGASLVVDGGYSKNLVRYRPSSP